MTTRLLFICLGNICRSPTAEAIARQRLPGDTFAQIDSAGTSDWHIGNPPDPRSIAAGAARGYDIKPLRGRQIIAADFHRFDHIIGMDASNMDDLRSLQPAGSRAQLHLLRDFGTGPKGQDVPDPNYGSDGFDEVITLLEDAMGGIAATLQPRRAAE